MRAQFITRGGGNGLYKPVKMRISVAAETTVTTKSKSHLVLLTLC